MFHKFLFTFFLSLLTVSLFSEAEIHTLSESVTEELFLEKLEKSQPDWNKKLNFDEISKRLETEQILGLTPMNKHLDSLEKTVDYTNEVYFVVLESGLKAVFKPYKEDGEGLAEVAAYKLSQCLDLSLVPPTCIREINGKVGSLQFYVSSSIDFANNEEKRLQVFKSVNEENLLMMKIFYFLVGQWDIGPSNQIVSYNNDAYNLALIDHAAITQKQYVTGFKEAPFVAMKHSDERDDDFDTSFPFKEAIIVTGDNWKENEDLKSFQVTPGKHAFFKDEKGSFTYVTWRNRLWVQLYKEADFFRDMDVSKPPSAFWKKLVSLNEEKFSRCWSDGYPADWNKNRKNEFVSTFFNRKARLLIEKYALDYKETGRINWN